MKKYGILFGQVNTTVKLWHTFFKEQEKLSNILIRNYHRKSFPSPQRTRAKFIDTLPLTPHSNYHHKILSKVWPSAISFFNADHLKTCL